MLVGDKGETGAMTTNDFECACGKSRDWLTTRA